MNEQQVLDALKRLGAALAEWMRAGNDARRFPFNDWLDQNMLPLYQAEFSAIMAARFAQLGTGLGIDTGLPDTRAVNRLAAGRLRILNLPRQARDSIAQILAQGRADGLSPLEMVGDIAQRVPAGRYASVEQRARVIAREETAIAQNHATLDALQAAGYTHVRARDAQLGPTDAECEARDGRVFTIADARREQETEHVNGTLSWDPI